jgi:alpha-1,6-mannosyltransferase
LPVSVLGIAFEALTQHDLLVGPTVDGGYYLVGTNGGTVAHEQGRTVKLTPSHRLYGLGAILLVTLTISSRKLSTVGEPSFILPLAVAGIAYLFAIREFFSTPEFPLRVIVIGLVLAALWHVPFLLARPGLDDDIHRYVWDGRMQRLGYNPYFVVPSDPALAALHTPETRTLNNPDVPSPYPAGAQLFFRAVTAIHESIFAFKVAFVLCDLAVVLVLLDVLRSSRQGAHWVLAYAWNPLLATEVAGSGHIDIVGVLLLLVSAAALARRWRAVAAVAFGLAVAVKFLPIVLVPLYWKRVRIRDAALAAIVIGLLYLPFFNHGRIPTGSLGTYVQRFRFNDPVFATLERVVAPPLVIGLAVLVGFLTAIWLRSKAPEWSPDTFAWPMAASLLCAPVIYPWYLLWLLPFLRSASTVPIVIWTVSIIPTYYVWHLRAIGRPWFVPGWIMLLEYGSVATAGAIIMFRRFTRQAVTRCSTD